MNPSSILAVDGLDVHYDKVHAVQGASFTLARGRLTTIIGSNGAGKSTLLKAIAGLLKPTAGSIRFNGEELAGRDVDQIVKRGISLVPEGRRLFATMSVRENLAIGAYLRSDADAIKRDFDRVTSYFPDLVAKLDVPAQSLSGGQQQMVAVGRALMSAPKLLMLDEPSIGLAPNLVRIIGRIVKTICESGVDVLLIEQNASMALDLADDAFILENGRVVSSGPARELARDDSVKRAYLGI
jgi:branched-chain amino acid transport system ATP-binding protein